MRKVQSYICTKCDVVLAEGDYVLRVRDEPKKVWYLVGFEAFCRNCGTTGFYLPFMYSEEIDAWLGWGRVNELFMRGKNPYVFLVDNLTKAS